MKVIIVGSGTIGNVIEIIAKAVAESGFNITEVVIPTALGVGRSAEDFANLRGVPIRRFPANWQVFGNRAGHLRNCQMFEYADAMIAIWDGDIKGTSSMVTLAGEFHLPVFLVELSDRMMERFKSDKQEASGDE